MGNEHRNEARLGFCKTGASPSVSESTSPPREQCAGRGLRNSTCWAAPAPKSLENRAATRPPATALSRAVFCTDFHGLKTNHKILKNIMKGKVKPMTSGVRFVEGESGPPPALFDTVDALHALRDFGQDLAVHGASWVGLPVQNPKEITQQKIEVSIPVLLLFSFSFFSVSSKRIILQNAKTFAHCFYHLIGIVIMRRQ